MRKLLAVSSLAVLAVACSSEAPHTGSPSEPAPTGVGAGVPTSEGGTKTIASFEGSFNAATNEVAVAWRDAETGRLLPEGTLPYGSAAGQVLVHTCGTHADGYTHAGTAPPVFNSTNNQLSWEFSLVNGTGSTISSAAIVFDSVSAAGVTLTTTDESGCSGSLPCTATLNGGTVANNPSFPSTTGLCNEGVTSNTAVFDDTANGGANFSFAGHVTGTLPTVCTKAVTTCEGASCAGTVNPYGQTVSISYSMVGGGGGLGGFGGGGGGGASALSNGATTITAPGGAGATAATSTSGTLSLASGQTLTAIVGGGGGYGGSSSCGNGGSGGGGGAGASAGGGGGGNGTSQSGGGAGGGSGGGAAGAAGASPGNRGAGGAAGTAGAGGGGGIVKLTPAGGGGNVLTGGSPGGASTCEGGGGGGYGGGGGGSAGAGGSNGVNGANSGGLGAVTNWSSSTTLPTQAGGAGGNAGLIILTYSSPNGTCSL